MPASSASVALTDSAFIVTRQPVTKLIQIAYGLSFGSMDQVVSGPEWMRKDAFDIVGTLPATSTGAAKTPDVGEMVRTLLAKRFRLKAHRETREIPVYTLVIARNGLKMKVTTDLQGGDCCFLRRQSATQFEGHGTSIETFTNLLSELPEIGGKLVLDKTERNAPTDRYDFVLKWSPDMDGAAAPADSSASSLFTALKEELGLQLESSKAHVEVIVIDSIERPTDN